MTNVATFISADQAPSATLDRRQRRSAKLRQQLLGAALKLFAHKGFAETTVEDITQAADVGKGTFFNYFPTKDHILLAFSEMQLMRLETAVKDARRKDVPIREFFRSLGALMTPELASNPAIIRMLLRAYLSTTPVRGAMTDLQKRAHALHSQMMQIGQDRGEIRKDLPAAEIASVFRETVFGTLLIWSLFGDASLLPRLELAINVLWTGLLPHHYASGDRRSDGANSVGEKKRRSNERQGCSQRV
jgi:AcrR family transcriptional regulator